MRRFFALAPFNGLVVGGSADGDEGGIELGDHRRDGEQEFAHGFGGVMDAPMLSLVLRPARFSDISWASRADRTWRLSLVPAKVSQALHATRASRSPVRFLALPGKAMVNIDAFRLDSKDCQCITWSSEVLFFRGDACVTDH